MLELAGMPVLIRTRPAFFTSILPVFMNCCVPLFKDKDGAGVFYCQPVTPSDVCMLKISWQLLAFIVVNLSCIFNTGICSLIVR